MKQLRTLLIKETESDYTGDDWESAASLSVRN